ncbi:hypothetical protein [Actinophytocola sp.]|uniref:hypothetical protein n=1 Tax=Actinophytocola sp. TaxID=1872138 RepID=UPI002ED24E79
MIMLSACGSVDPAGEARFAGGFCVVMDAFLTLRVRKASITTSRGKPGAANGVFVQPALSRKTLSGR